jgi:hypothetical protein
MMTTIRFKTTRYEDLPGKPYRVKAVFKAYGYPWQAWGWDEDKNEAKRKARHALWQGYERIEADQRLRETAIAQIMQPQPGQGA